MTTAGIVLLAAWGILGGLVLVVAGAWLRASAEDWALTVERRGG